MTDTDTILEAVRDESRRSFMKKGAIAAGGLALGGSATAAANTNVQQAGSALVFTYSYFPGRQFQVLANLQQDVVDQVLGRQIQGEPVISDTADFNAYIGNYQASQGGGPGEYFLLFTQETGLQQGQQYMFDTGASFFSTQFNLLEASLTSGGGGGGGDVGGGNQTAGGNQTVGGGETAGGATNGNGGA